MITVISHTAEFSNTRAFSSTGRNLLLAIKHAEQVRLEAEAMTVARVVVVVEGVPIPHRILEWVRNGEGNGVEGSKLTRAEDLLAHVRAGRPLEANSFPRNSVREEFESTVSERLRRMNEAIARNRSARRPDDPAYEGPHWLFLPDPAPDDDTPPQANRPSSRGG